MNTPIYKLATSPDSPVIINNRPERVLPFLKNELSRLESDIALFNSCKEIEATPELKAELLTMLAEFEADAAHCRQVIGWVGGVA